jgi:hypothetical protein
MAAAQYGSAGAITNAHLERRRYLGAFHRLRRLIANLASRLHLGKSTTLKPTLRTTFACAAAALLAVSVASAAEPQPISPAALQADLRLAVETIERIHPDLTHSVDPADLMQAVKNVERQLVQPMSQAQAWATLAQLNPVLADGHLLIGLPDWRGASAEALNQGIAFFPF